MLFTPFRMTRGLPGRVATSAALRTLLGLQSSELRRSVAPAM